MENRPIGYILEWRPGRYCSYTFQEYERETYRTSARVYEAHHSPQPDNWQEPIGHKLGTGWYLGKIVHEPE